MRAYRQSRWIMGLAAGMVTGLATLVAGEADPSGVAAGAPRGQGWILPAAREVELGGALGAAWRRGVARLGEDPYRSVVYLRSDLTFEMKRPFTNYSGDISGRFLEIGSLTSPLGKIEPNTLAELLATVASYQQADGHFGRPIDWTTPVDPPEDSTAARATKTPILWGNSRLLVGLLEAHAAVGRAELLKAARGIGDFYVSTADRLMDPARKAQYKATGTYAEGYVTDYFPAIEGLVRLYEVTHDARYLGHAERMAEFFKRFDKLPIDHSHGNLIAYHGLVLLYETTGKREYLDRALARWKEAVEGGYVWPTGGVGEKFHVNSVTDEGCSEADWLRLNLDLWRITGETRFLDTAERLLTNHYPMNRTANGGYGHHNFVCDAEGPLVMQPQFTEAVWCCTFHGLLGLHTLKRYVVAGSDRGVVVNFPLDVVAPVRVGTDVWKVAVRRLRDSDQAVGCRVAIEPLASGAKPPPVLFRRPDWAEEVRVSDAAGRMVEAPCERGYLRLGVKPGAQGELTVTFAFAPRVEDRRMRPVKIDARAVGRYSGVVLCNGPRVLLVNADRPRPIVVLTADEKGRVRLPKSEGAKYTVATVASIEAPEAELREAMGKPGALELAPWEAIDPKRAAAFVLDLIVVGDGPGK